MTEELQIYLGKNKIKIKNKQLRALNLKKVKFNKKKVKRNKRKLKSIKNTVLCHYVQTAIHLAITIVTSSNMEQNIRENIGNMSDATIAIKMVILPTNVIKIVHNGLILNNLIGLLTGNNIYYKISDNHNHNNNLRLKGKIEAVRKITRSDAISVVNLTIDPTVLN